MKAPVVIGTALVATLVLAAAWSFTRHRDAASPTPAQPPGETCALLDDAAILRVQGEAPINRQATESPQPDLQVSQCFYSLPTASKSVVVTLTARGQGSGARDPRDAWKEMFAGGARDREREHEREREPEGSVRGAPEKIADLGDDARWVGGSIGGALYLLSGERILRISVGGPGTVAEKKDRSIALARTALEKR